MPNRENVMLVGGFDQSNYVDRGDVFNLNMSSSIKWTNRDFYKPAGGGRINHACGLVRVDW